MPLSFIMTEAECKAVDCYSFLSAGRKKTDGQKKKKREGTEQIEPFHHTLTSFTSAGIAKPFLLPHK